MSCVRSKRPCRAGWRSNVQGFFQRPAACARLVLRRAHLRRLHACALHRLDHANAAAVLGHGNGLHRLQPLRRAYQLQSRVPRHRHLRGRGRCGVAGADVRADPGAAGADRGPVDRHPVVSVLAPAHGQQLCTDAGGLHPADDRLASGGQPLGRVRHCLCTDPGNFPRYRLCGSGRRGVLAPSAGAGVGRCNRQMVRRGDHLQ
ncbi:hypothetical protein D3C76_296600 [compost metagenome]